MATNKANTNRISLKLAIILDEKETLARAKALQKQLDKLNKEAEKKSSLADGQSKFNKELKQSESGVRKLGKEFKTMITKAVKFAVVSSIMLTFRKVLKDAISLAFELDKSFTNFAIVSKATASEIAEVDRQVSELTKRLGALKKEVIDSVTEFNRAGFSIQESLQLAETAIIGANVGMTELTNVTTFLVAGLKAFRLEAEESTRILDVLFRVANTTAIDLEGIGQAFLRSANTLNTAGATLEESAALIAAANESIQDPAKIGSALNTIASRLRGVGVEGEAIPKLAQSFRDVGIEIQNADGSFRDIFTIFEEFANIYEDLDEITRESLLEKLAGKRQKNVLIGLLTNFDTAKQAVKDAEESAGESARAQEKFLQSLEGQAKLLKDAWNSLLETLRNSGAIEVVIKFLTSLANGLGAIIKNVPIVITGIGALTASLVGFGSALAIATSGFSILIGGLALIAQGVFYYKGSTESLTNALKKQNMEISSLNEKIGNLKALKDRTDAENELLEVYENQLENQQRLKDITLEGLADEQLRNTQSLFKDLRDDVEKTTRTFRKAGKEYVVDVRVSDKELIEYERKLIETLESTQEIIDSTSESSNAYKDASEAYKQASEALELVNETQIRYGYKIRESKKDTDNFTSALGSQLIALQEAKSLSSTSAEEYRKLSDALVELEENGYLTNDTINTLKDSFPEIIEATGLTKEAFRDFVESNSGFTKDQIEANKALLQSEIDTAEARIEALIKLSEVQSIIDPATGEDSSGYLRRKLAEVRNLENQIVLLDNQLAIIKAIDKARSKSGGGGSTSRDIKLLTDLEIALLKVNNQIDVQSKKLQITEDDKERVRITEELIELYKQQREILIQQQESLTELNAGIKKTDEGYEDFINESNKLSSAIQGTTNDIYGLNKSLEEMNTQIAKNKLESLRGRLSALIEESSQNLINSAREEAKLLREEIEDLQESYNLRKKNLEISREAFDHAKKMANFNDEIAKREKEAEMLKLDNSLESQRRQAVLAEEIADLQVNKQEEVDNYSRVLEDRRLEEDYENERKNLEARLKNQEDFIDSIEETTKEAMSNIQNEFMFTTVELETIMESFAKNIGKVLEENVIAKFDKMGDKAGGLLGLLDDVGSGNLGNIFDDVGKPDTSKNSVIAKMKANSAKWSSASQAERARLNAENISLAKSIGYKYDSAGFYIPESLSSSASWEDKQNSRLYDNGGKLEKGDVAINKEQNSEWVLTDGNLMSIFENGMTKVFSMANPMSRLDRSQQDGSMVDKLINIENMNNNIASDYDTRRMTEEMARTSKNKLSAFGYKF